MRSKLRRWFVEDVESEHPLGTHQRGVYWITQRALVARIDGQRELVIERSGGLRGFGEGSLQYFHVPADGFDDLRQVGERLLAGDLGPAPGLGEHLARWVMHLVSLPIVLAVIGFPLGMLAMLVLGFAGAEAEQDLVGTCVFLGVATLFFGGGALLVLVMKGIAVARGETMDAVEAMRRFGPVRHIAPLGTYRGALGKDGWDRRLRPATVRVMASASGPGWLLLTRLWSGGLARGVGVYEIPAGAVPALLEVVAELRARSLSTSAT